jgi:hypothetical protein
MSKSAKWFSRRRHAPTYERISHVYDISDRLDPRYYHALGEAPMRRLLANRLAFATGVTVILMSILFALLRVAG